jgi:hypothetical protein
MGIEAATVYLAVCDTCGCHTDTHGSSHLKAELASIDAGWRVDADKGLVLCPKCDRELWRANREQSETV